MRIKDHLGEDALSSSMVTSVIRHYPLIKRYSADKCCHQQKNSILDNLYLKCTSNVKVCHHSIHFRILTNHILI